ncbi:hypothetical protein FACS1894147_00880 [Spirochaetia bacterium]|nr:hypothetical protein FACS1894147_00880 [Spirochaetia bacterium]
MKPETASKTVVSAWKDFVGRKIATYGKLLPASKLILNCDFEGKNSLNILYAGLKNLLKNQFSYDEIAASIDLDYDRNRAQSNLAVLKVCWDAMTKNTPTTITPIIDGTTKEYFKTVIQNFFYQKLPHFTPATIITDEMENLKKEIASIESDFVEPYVLYLEGKKTIEDLKSAFVVLTAEIESCAQELYIGNITFQGDDVVGQLVKALDQCWKKTLA